VLASPTTFYLPLLVLRIAYCVLASPTTFQNVDESGKVSLLWGDTETDFMVM